jgi:hypothetical protein
MFEGSKGGFGPGPIKYRKKGNGPKIQTSQRLLNLSNEKKETI